MKILDMLFADVGALLVLRVEELVDNNELHLVKRRDKERLRLLLLTTVSWHKKMQSPLHF